MSAVELWLLLSLAGLVVYALGVAVGEAVGRRRAERRFAAHVEQAIEVTR